MQILTEKAFEQEWQFRDATQQELLKFKQILRDLILKASEKRDIKNLVLEKLQADEQLIQALNTSLGNFPAGTEATWSLKTNKMLEILNGAIKFINENFDAFIKSIEDNDELTNYHIKTEKNNTTIIANTGESIYGTSKASFFKAALINTYLIYSRKKYLSEIDVNNKGYWIDQTPSAHVTPLPDKLNPADIKVNGTDFTQCTYFYNDNETPQGLAFIHSGYAFGGYRNESRYPYQPPKQLGKLNGPEDCSSFIGKLTLEVDGISTADLWNRWKYQRDGFSTSLNWENTPAGKLLIAQYVPADVSDTTKIKTGQVWASRSFDTELDPEMKGDGKGGHTVLVVDGIDENEKVKAIGYNRDMPNIEGFGLQSFPVHQINKRILFFNVSPKEAPETSESSAICCCCN